MFKKVKVQASELKLNCRNESQKSYEAAEKERFKGPFSDCWGCSRYKTSKYTNNVAYLYFKFSTFKKMSH